MKTKILVLGNKAIAIGCLKYLMSYDEIELLGLVSCYNDHVGDWYPSASMFATTHGIRVYSPRNINDGTFLSVIAEMAPDLIISAQYDRILKAPVISLPRLGAINVHFAPLPKHRGMMPLVWALVDGTDAGVTLHYIDEGIDTGDLIAQTIIPLRSKDTARSLYDKATEEGNKLLRQYLPLLLNGYAPRIKQDESQSSYHMTGYPNNRWIDWTWEEERIDRFIRALTFPPYPGARMLVNGKEIELVYKG